MEVEEFGICDICQMCRNITKCPNHNDISYCKFHYCLECADPKKQIKYYETKISNAQNLISFWKRDIRDIRKKYNLNEEDDTDSD